MRKLGPAHRSWPELPQGQMSPRYIWPRLSQHSIANQPWTLTAHVGQAPCSHWAEERMRRLGSPLPHKLAYGAQLLGHLGSGIESPLSSPKRPLMTGSGQGQRQARFSRESSTASLSRARVSIASVTSPPKQSALALSSPPPPLSLPNRSLSHTSHTLS